MKKEENLSGWAQLLCSYFYETCVRVVGDYFLSKGFCPKKTRIGGALFFDGRHFVELSYDPESFPQYSPSIVVGMGECRYSATGEIRAVPLGSVIPSNRSETKYSTWKFSNIEELATVLEKIRVEILDVYAIPIVSDEEKLVSEVERFARQALSNGKRGS